MRIKKRLSPEDRADSLWTKGWRRVLLHPHIATITRYCHGVTASDLLDIVAQAKKGHRFTGIKLEHKLLLYFFCSIMWRGIGVSPLTDPEYNTLVRHLYAGKTLESIEASAGGLSLHYRQIFLWDMPQIAERYKKKGIMPLPQLPKPKKKLKRLAKHKRP